MLHNLLLLLLLAVCAIGAIQFKYHQDSVFRYRTTNALSAVVPQALATNQYDLNPLFVKLSQVVPEVNWQASRSDIQLALKGTSRTGKGTYKKEVFKDVGPIDKYLLGNGWEEDPQFLANTLPLYRHGYKKAEQGKTAIVIVSTTLEDTKGKKSELNDTPLCPCPYEVTVFYTLQ